MNRYVMGVVAVAALSAVCNGEGTAEARSVAGNASEIYWNTPGCFFEDWGEVRAKSPACAGLASQAIITPLIVDDARAHIVSVLVDNVAVGGTTTPVSCVAASFDWVGPLGTGYVSPPVSANQYGANQQ